jgi:hypothetical protein
MALPGIPKYGQNFTLEHLPCNPADGLAPRRYVSKVDRLVSIRSTIDSEHWTVYVGPVHDAKPQDGPYDTLAEAMRYAVGMVCALA